MGLCQDPVGVAVQSEFMCMIRMRSSLQIFGSINLASPPFKKENVFVLFFISESTVRVPCLSFFIQLNTIKAVAEEVSRETNTCEDSCK